MMNNNKILFICTLYVLLFLLPSNIVAQNTTLKFHQGQFKIMQLTDLHWHNASSFEEENDSTWNLIDQMLKIEKPQLVVFTGDVVVADNALKCWKRIATLFERHKALWMVTFGNHDTEADASTRETAALIASLPYCLMPQSLLNISGVGNLSVPIWNEAESEMKWMLYFMDSHAYPAMPFMGSYDWIKLDQINWYRHERDKAQKNNGGNVVPGLAFFHIPLPEFSAGKDLCKKIGTHMDGVCSPILNSGLFSAFLEKHDVAGVFCGHDHNNDYLLDFKGHIALGYGRKTGYVSAYREILPRGVRIIELHNWGRAFRTYIRDLEGISHEYEFEVRHGYAPTIPHLTLSNYLIKPEVKGVFVGRIISPDNSDNAVKIVKDTAHLFCVKHDSLFLRPKRTFHITDNVQSYGITLRVGNQKKDFEILVDQFEKNKVIAHRGAWKHTSTDQNTIESFTKAVEKRCHGSEFDVWLTKDKQIVLSHDPVLCGLPVEKSLLKQLRELTLSKGGKVSTLEELIEVGKQQGRTKMILEIKPSTIDAQRGIELADSVISCVHRMKAQAWMEYISFDYDVLRRIHYLDPFAKTQYLAGDKGVKEVKKDGLTGIDYSFYSFRSDPQLMQKAHNVGLTVNVWTVNQPDELRQYYHSEIDYITTDEPEILLEMK